MDNSTPYQYSLPIEFEHRGRGKKYPVLTDDLIALYCRDCLTLDQIAELTGATKRTIANRLIAAGIPRRGYGERYNVAEKHRLLEYFKDWANQSPYILGYLYADGSIDALNPNSPGVSFNSVDEQLARDIAIEIGLVDRLRIKPRPKCKIQYKLSFYGSEIVQLMADYGIHPRKTWTDYGFPDMPDEALPHFIRGAFDGDGWACWHEKAVSFGLCGPKTFVEDFADRLHTFAGLKPKTAFPKPGMWVVHWQSGEDARRFLRYVYPEGDYIYLKRKRLNIERIAARPNRSDGAVIGWQHRRVNSA